MKLNLTIEKSIQIYVVLTQHLDGFDKIIKDKDGTDKLTRCLFEFGALRLDIAKNANRLKPTIDVFDKARNDLIKEITGGKEELKPLENPEGLKRFSIEMTKMQAHTEDIDLIPFKRDVLKLDVNPIPIIALMVLDENGLLTD